MNLVDDCITYILTLLDIKTLVCFSGINKQFNLLCKNELLWLKYCNLLHYEKCDTTYYKSFKSLTILKKFLQIYNINSSLPLLCIKIEQLFYLSQKHCSLNAFMYKMSTLSLTHLKLQDCQ